jgi:heme-degrading monooxygenase HmoA
MITPPVTARHRSGRARVPAGELTVTSVFTLLDEERQEQLYALLSANGHDVLERTPGFLGSTLTRCEDGRHIVHHARWRDADAVTAMLADPGAQATMAASRRLAQVQVFRSHHSESFTGS